MNYRRTMRRGRTVPDKATGTVTISPAEYRQNLEQLVVRLEQTGAALRWASTTAVPPDDPGRFSSDVERYNAVADSVMSEHGIPVIDLYGESRAFPAAWRQGPGDVHFTAEGYAGLGARVARDLDAVLPVR